MNDREHLHHKATENTWLFLMVILISSVFILLFPSSLSIGRQGRIPLSIHSR